VAECVGLRVAAATRAQASFDESKRWLAMRKPMTNINSGRDLREVAKAWGTDARGHADSVTGLHVRLVAGEAHSTSRQSRARLTSG
jgi:hypothetical protein